MTKRSGFLVSWNTQAAVHIQAEVIKCLVQDLFDPQCPVLARQAQGQRLFMVDLIASGNKDSRTTGATLMPILKRASCRCTSR